MVMIHPFCGIALIDPDFIFFINENGETLCCLELLVLDDPVLYQELILIYIIFLQKSVVPD